MMPELPRLGLGCASLARPSVGDDEAVETILAALAGGIGYVDVAPLYGSGLGERRLGQALAAWSGARPRLSTKVGFAIDGQEGMHQPQGTRRHDYSASGIRRSLEGSLERLGVDRLDLVSIHEPEAATGQVPAAFETLSRLREAGLFDAIGIGTNSAAAAIGAMECCPLDAVLIAGRYTLLDRSADRLLDLCAGRDTTVIVGGVFNSGILAADDPASGHFDYRPAPPARIAATRQLRAVCDRFGSPLKAAAMQFAGRDPRVTTTLIGAASRTELAECLADLSRSLPEGLWAELRVVADAV